MAAPDTSDPDGMGPRGTIMHRKAEAGRARHKARAMSLAKALRLTCAKVADTLLELQLAVIGLRAETRAGEGIGDSFDAGHLLMLLDGPLQNRAAASMDADLVAALIQQQTMGKVGKPDEGDARPFTTTDAAVCAPFLDAVLTRAAPMSEDIDEQRLISGYAFGAWVESPRVLSIALDANEYEVIQITVDIAGGVRQGQITLCLPHLSADVDLPEDDAEMPLSHPVPDLSQTLCDTVQNLNADLRIGLASLHLPVRQLGALEPGATLDIGAPDFARVMVMAADGRVVSRGALGQVAGQRAVQVAHTYKGMQAPRRRASDRDDLNLPAIAQEQEGAVAPELPDISAPAPLPDLPAPPPELAAPPDLPEPAAVPELPELPDLPDMSDLPDLPDMSDLPDLDDLPDLAALKAG